MATAVRILDAAQALQAVAALAGVLIDCVHGGASVSFLAPLPLDKALAFWQGVARGERVLLMPDGAPCSTTCFHKQLGQADQSLGRYNRSA